jgi:sulfonate transport system ATP-binding protein
MTTLETLVPVGDPIPLTPEPARTETHMAVRAIDVHRTFGNSEILRGVDLDIASGEFVALLGRSGSGKSTLLKIIAGLDHEAVGDLTVPARRAVVFQDSRLLPWARVLDNVVLGLRGGDADNLGRAALEEVGLAAHANAWPKTLSGGESQRAAIARALVRSPDLLLLDEPFGALDALTRIRMHVLVQQLCARHRPAVLLVTHDVDEAILLADRILVLDEGRISLDVAVDIDAPRLRGDASFAQLRTRLLAALGVDEAAEGDHRGRTDATRPNPPNPNQPTPARPYENHHNRQEHP